MASLQVVIQTVIYICFVATSLAHSERKKRIVNGKEVTDLSHPQIASIQFKVSRRWQHACGGALIAQNKVLTAAHCLDGKRSADIRVVVGLVDLNGPPNRYKQTLRVSSFAVHENHNYTVNDIAVLNLSGKVVLNKGVQIATLAPKGASFAGVKCVITGWGHTVSGGDISAQLHEVRITKITTADCAKRWSGENINIRNICVYEASAAPGSRPSDCRGDSGGPMICNGYLAGISSWSTLNCTGDHPSVYTRVSEFLDWIKQRL